MKMFVAMLLVSLLLSFSLGVLAQRTLTPDGYSWDSLSDGRKLGFVEGYIEGQMDAMVQRHCVEHTSNCVLKQLYGDSRVDPNTPDMLKAMETFYAMPQNLPVSWGHATIIAGAVVSGVPVAESDLEKVRKADADVHAK
jgi:hypothetical protein